MPAGYELPFLLFSGFRSIMDEVHDELTRNGFPDVRPAHGLAMQAIGPHGATATELGRRLGVSKQAAGKTAERLEDLGLATRATDSGDHRRKLITLTPLGTKALTLSVTALDDIRARWSAALGSARLDELESTLRAMVPGAG